MTKKRVSLAEIEKEDVAFVSVRKPKSEKKYEAIPKSEIRKNKEDIGNMKNSDSLSDYTKMSVTVAVEVFEQLQDISRQRRRAKQPFKLTELVREALSEWLPKQES